MSLPEPGLTPLELLQSSSLPALLQREIERLILAGAIAAGDRLNESELALKFGTSRGPIREALRALEQGGLVRLEKNRGVFVRVISLAEADQIYEVRAALDQQIGRLAAERATDADVRELRRLAAEMQRAAQGGRADAYHPLNLAFHDRLAQMGGNAKLLAIYRRLVNELSLFRREALAAGDDTLLTSIREHQALVAAVAARDAARAARALAEHVEN
ncbi:phosphonate utilization associated transcriptional regulator, partial [Acidovorax sp.]|uniref:phosphonate utilization associated transcriptional regulator n=1 Tax=Acidovorax sp. TaxID=1872122 RepID=UPI004037D74E